MNGKYISASAGIAEAGNYDPSVSGDSVVILMEDEGLIDSMGVGRLLIPLFANTVVSTQCYRNFSRSEQF